MSMENRYSIQFGSVVIEYKVEYNDRKSLTIKVYPDTSVRAIAPFDTPLEKVEQHVKKKMSWILKQQREFLSYHPLTPPRIYVNGETHLYLGRQYKLRIETADMNEVKLYRGRLVVACKDNKNVREILNNWYRQKAFTHFEEILDNIFPLFGKYKISKPELSLRSMEKRWGSCTPNGKVILNPELIKAYKCSIEYVIIHELCHLIYHNHTKSFYELQESLMPDWKKWKEKLEHSLV